MNTHPRPDVRLASHMCRQILHYYKTLLHTVQNIRRTEKKRREQVTWMVKGKMCTVTKGT